jgi:hypothetical protein
MIFLGYLMTLYQLQTLFNEYRNCSMILKRILKGAWEEETVTMVCYPGVLKVTAKLLISQ